MHSKWMVLVVLIAITGCAVGPNYHRPGVLVPAKFKEQKGSSFVAFDPKQWKKAEPQDEATRGDWWKIFKDPVLNSLEDELHHCNQSIANAAANYYQSLAIVEEARSALYPTLSGAFNAIRQRTGGGATSFISTSGGTTSSGTASTGNFNSNPMLSTSFSAFLNVNWEPDIWGLVRRTIESDAAAAQSNKALLAVTQLSAEGSLAQYYFELRTLDGDQVLLNKTVQGYKKSLKITVNQYKSGTVSRANVLQAQSLVETAEAQAINNGILRAQYEHAIAVLIGKPPALFQLAKKPLREKPPVIPVIVPTEWLERRPDIAQAERLMHAANAQIGVAIAAFYPTITLGGNISAAGDTLGQLFSKPAIGWAYTGQLAETIYDGGLRSATVRAAQAAYQASVATYRQTVLTAFQNVEDMLVALRILKEETKALNSAALLAKKALQLLLNEYKAGTVDFTSVIVAEVNYYTAQKNAYDAVGLQMTAAVGLVKAMGGGWKSVRCCP